MKPADIDFHAFAKSVGTIVRHHAGNEVFREGDDADVMYVVLEGEIVLESRGKDVGVVGRDGAIGITSLIDEQPRPNTARAKTDCELVMITREKFRYMLEEVPSFLWFVLHQLTRRLRGLNEAI